VSIRIVLQSKSPNEANRRLLVCFDFEGSYGMPHAMPYNLHESAHAILRTLGHHQAHATFFVVGRLAEEHPQIVRALADAGHEIGLHGYNHDDLASYNGHSLAQLDDDLASAESRIEEIAGVRPACFRAPYLLAPHFYRAEIYALLRAHGYRWVSNREVRYPIELLRPDRLPIHGAWRRKSTGAPRLANSPVLLALLNAGLVMKGTFGRSLIERLRWLLGQRGPFVKDGLVEVPLYAPLDCDLLGLPHPQHDTPPELLAYAREAIRAMVVAPRALAMVNFHDWIVSGGNRLVLLNDALATAHEAGMVISTIAANPQWLPQVTHSRPTRA
jgi:peptidoglycan/xylan/chitin deacetylase (PgdA/CDA1 family)